MKDEKITKAGAKSAPDIRNTELDPSRSHPRLLSTKKRKHPPGSPSDFKVGGDEVLAELTAVPAPQDRLLGTKELDAIRQEWLKLEVNSYEALMVMTAKAQRDLTASIKDAGWKDYRLGMIEGRAQKDAERKSEITKYLEVISKQAGEIKELKAEIQRVANASYQRAYHEVDSHIGLWDHGSELQIWKYKCLDCGHGSDLPQNFCPRCGSPFMLATRI